MPFTCKGTCRSVVTKYSPFIDMFINNRYCTVCEVYISKSFPNRCVCCGSIMRSKARRTAKRHITPIYSSARWGSHRGGSNIRIEIKKLMRVK